MDGWRHYRKHPPPAMGGDGFDKGASAAYLLAAIPTLGISLVLWVLHYLVWYLKKSQDL